VTRSHARCDCREFRIDDAVSRENAERFPVGRGEPPSFVACDVERDIGRLLPNDEHAHRHGVLHEKILSKHRYIGGPALL